MTVKHVLLAAVSSVALLAAAPAIAQDNSEAGPGNAAQDDALIGDSNSAYSGNHQ